MKRWIAALLIVLLLAQALPLNALAAVGYELTSTELAAAYALTGLGEGSEARANTYHKGMMPNENWNAMQLSDWLDDMLDTYIYSVEDIFSRTLVKIEALRQKDPKGYEHFMSSPKYEGVHKLMKDMYLETEELRQELRYQRDRIEELAGVIAEMKARLEDTDNAMFSSDRVRLSAKIETASKELKVARQEIADKAAQWQLEIQLTQATLDEAWPGQGEDDSPQDLLGDWLSELSTYGEEVVDNRAQVTVVNASNTLLGRMSAGGSVLSNAAEATTRVIGENEVALVFNTGSGDEKRHIQDIKVTIKDNRSKDAEAKVYTSDKSGRVILSCNNYISDDDKKLHLKVDVDAETQGFRSFGIDELEMKLGQIREEPLIPLDDNPYIYSASFNGHDILRDEWEMLYSDLNTWEFDIKVTTRKPGGGNTPPPMFSYWTSNGFMRNWKQNWADATSHSGNTYVFRNKWKKIIVPELSRSQSPFFAFSKDEDAEHCHAGLVSLKSVVDSPVQEGSDVFEDVLTDALSFKFTIPVIDVEVSLDLPFKQYLPKVSIDLAGYVTASIGSDMFTEKLEDKKVNWQSKDLRDLKYDQEYYEKEGWWANYKSQYGVAYDYYKQKGSKFLAESKLEFGVFALLSGRWEIDNRDEDVKTKVVNLRGAVGFLAKYSFSWTWAFTLGAVPAYVCLTLGVSAGVAIGLELGFSWVNGKFQDWKLRVIKDITISVRFSFTAQAGVGIKGFAEIWMKFSAALDLKIMLLIWGGGPNSVTVSYGLDFSVGATIFWVTISKTWTIAKGIIYPRNNANGIMNPLQQYSLAAANEPEEIIPAGQEPAAYPDLVPLAKAEMENVLNVKSNAKVAMIYGNPIAFYLKQVKGKDGKQHRRVAWRMVNNGIEGSTQDTIDTGTGLGSLPAKINGMDDYAFDVYVAESYVFVAVAAAKAFNADGTPKPNPDNRDDCNQFLYVTAFALTTQEEDRSKIRLTSKLPRGMYSTEDMEYYLVCGAPYVISGVTYHYESITDPEITWVQVNMKNRTSAGFQIYGTLGRVTYSEDDTPNGATSFRVVSGKDDIMFFSDETVESSMGAGYERTYIRGAMRNSEITTDIYGHPYARSFSFLALAKPKDGAEGDSTIEMFDWEMNSTADYEQGRKAVMLEKGEIDHFELVQKAANADGSQYARVVFYAAKETDDDGAVQDRLYGLYIEPVERSDRSLYFDVTKYTYDVTVPNGYFKVGYMGEMPYLYWIASVAAADGSDAEIWRVYTVAYDYSTNAMTAPAVYAEFTLPKMTYRTGGKTYSVDAIPHTLILSGEDISYMTTVANVDQIPEADRPVVPPVTLYSFPTLMKPSIDLSAMIMEDTVAAGDFEDLTIALMNDGNMGIASFDLHLTSLEGGKQKVVETIHVNCLDPEKNNLKLLSGTKLITIAEGKKVAYRNGDFDYTARKRDWVLAQEKKEYQVYVGTRDELVSVDTVDTKTEYVATDMLMPGALASFTATIKIPENWQGNKTLSLKLVRLTTYSNWVNAMTRAAGVSNDHAPVKNVSNVPEELVYELNEKTGKLELQTVQSNGTVSEAARSGLYANAIDAPDEIALNLGTHDVDVVHRVYRDSEGERMMDIVISDYANTSEDMRLTCAVYVDGEKEPNYVNLNYYQGAVSGRATHTITMPVAALLPDRDPDAHQRMRVVIEAIDRDECTLVNNEFTVYLGGDNALRFAKQPEDKTVQEGEDVCFDVEVTGGTKPYKYQWQIWDEKHRKWVDLPGFTDPVLSREDIEKKWDGCKFRCVVTDAAGTKIISDVVTLTVRDRVPTGDNSNLPLYMGVALLALALLIILRKKEKRA